MDTGGDYQNLAIMTTPQAQLPISAGARVAGIPELLEQILLNLIDVSFSEAEEELEEEPEDPIIGLQTVLFSQRTAQAFRDTIIGSPAIRRALFCEDAKPAIDGFPKTNPMLVGSIVRHDIPDGNPFRVQVWPVWDFSRPYPARAAYKGYRVRLHRIYATRNRVNLRKRQGMDGRASWRQMHLLSETGSTPIIQLELRCASETSTLQGQFENPTLGEVFDLLHGKNAVP